MELVTNYNWSNIFKVFSITFTFLTLLLFIILLPVIGDNDEESKNTLVKYTDIKINNKYITYNKDKAFFCGLELDSTFQEYAFIISEAEIISNLDENFFLNLKDTIEIDTFKYSLNINL